MKTIVMLLSAMISTSGIALKKSPDYIKARRNGAEVKLNLFVADDQGMAVSNASVRVFMGMNFRPKGYWIRGETNERGSFSVQGRTCGDEIEIFVSKDGFYSSRRKLRFAEMGSEHKVKNGKWHPYGAVETLQLRKIRRPTALLNHGFGAGREIPETNVWIGVDMMHGDFIKPHGKGEQSDFEVMVEWDGYSPVASKYCATSMRFTEPLSGGYYVAKIHESEYPYVYGASENEQYAIRHVKVIGRGKSDRNERHPLCDEDVLVVRTRCVLGEDGTLKSAFYGFIRLFDVDAGWNGKPTMRLAYVFNPTPNDTNLELKR